MSHSGPADHITPYDRLALDEATLLDMLASDTRHEVLVEYFGRDLHAELRRLARAVRRRRAAPGRRVYLLPGIMGSQLGFVRGGKRPNDILWLDPIDFNFGRLTELRLPGNAQLIALGAMSYSYLKLTLSLRKAGFDAVLLDYDWRRDVASNGKALAERIAADGRDDVALVGHSMGGLVARFYVQRLDGDARVHTLVTLGTPHGGTKAARLIPHRLARQLRPDSELVAELCEPAPDCATRFLAVWSDLDQMMVPKRAARIDHPDLDARNVLVRGVGHMSLPIHRRTVHEIGLMLAQLDPHGGTVTPGVTPIGSDRPDRSDRRPPGPGGRDLRHGDVSGRTSRT